MTVSLLKTTDICANCGRDCAIPDSIEVDPLCTACTFDLAAEGRFINLNAPHDFWLIMHMTPRYCPGWGEDCGLLIFAPADLCGDCHAGRMDFQSPRIGNPRR